MNLSTPPLALVGMLAFASRALAQDAPVTELPAQTVSGTSSDSDAPPAHAPAHDAEVPGEPRTTLLPVGVGAYTGEYPIEIRPPVRIPRRRMEFGGSVDYVRMFGSTYDNLVALWGYDGFFDAVHFSARAFAVLRPVLLLGGRVGYAHSDGGRARADMQALAANVADVSAVLRIRHEWVGRHVIGRVGFDVEFGPAFGTLILRGQTDGFASLRLGGTVFMGFAPTPESPAIVFRLGVQYLPYAGAGAAWGDPVFAGIVLGAGVEGAR